VEYNNDWSKKLNARHFKTPYKRNYNRLLRSVRLKNLECDITYKDYLIFTEEKDCSYCGDSIPWIPHGKKANGYYLDRLDNTKGYLKKNCAVCCTECNFLKSNLCKGQFLARIHRIYKNTLE